MKGLDKWIANYVRYSIALYLTQRPGSISVITLVRVAGNTLPLKIVCFL